MIEILSVVPQFHVTSIKSLLLCTEVCYWEIKETSLWAFAYSSSIVRGLVCKLFGLAFPVTRSYMGWSQMRVLATNSY